MKSEIIAWNRVQWRHQLLRNGCGTGSTYCRDAGTGGGGGSAPLPHLIIFGRPVNPITIRGSRFCPHFKVEKI